MPVTPQQTIVDTSADPSLNYIRNRDINTLIAGGGTHSTSTDREVINNVVENVTQRVTKVVETNVLADWNATSGTGLILNKPNNLATTTYVDNAIANVSGGSGGSGNGIVDGTLTFTGGVITGPEFGVGLGMFGVAPTSDTDAGDIYLQGGFDFSEAGGPATRGGAVSISAGQGANDVDASHGGSVEIYAGPASQTGGDIRIESGSTYSGSGQAGEILIQSGSSVSGYGGNITIQSGVGTEGMQIFEGAVKMRGANVEVVSSFESFKVKTGDVDSQSGGPNVWEFDNTGNLTLPESGSVKNLNVSSSITADVDSSRNLGSLEKKFDSVYAGSFTSTDNIWLNTDVEYSYWYSIFGAGNDAEDSNVAGASTSYGLDGSVYVLGNYPKNGLNQLLAMKYSPLGDVQWKSTWSMPDDNNTLGTTNHIIDKINDSAYFDPQFYWTAFAPMSSADNIGKTYLGILDTATGEQHNATPKILSNFKANDMFASYSPTTAVYLAGATKVSNHSIPMVAKVSVATGEVLWAKKIPSLVDTEYNCATYATTTDNSLYVIGTNTSGSNKVAVLHKYDVNGVLVAAKNISVTGADIEGTCVEFNRVTHNIEVSVYKDDLNADVRASIVGSFDPSLTPLWTREVGIDTVLPIKITNLIAEPNIVREFDEDPGGNVYFAGQVLSGEFVANDKDFYVGKFDPRAMEVSSSQGFDWEVTIGSNSWAGTDDGPADYSMNTKLTALFDNRRLIITGETTASTVNGSLNNPSTSAFTWQIPTDGYLEDWFVGQFLIAPAGGEWSEATGVTYQAPGSLPTTVNVDALTVVVSEGVVKNTDSDLYNPYKLQIGGDYGTIRVGDSAITARSELSVDTGWSKLKLPYWKNSDTVAAYLTNPLAAGVYVRGGDAKITANAQGFTVEAGNLAGAHNTWNFGTNGVITLPQGGDIVDYHGTSVFPTPGEIPPGQTGEIIFNGTSIYNTAETSDIDIYTSGDNYSEVWLKDNDGVIITAVNPEAGPLQWKFGNDGTVLLPYGETSFVGTGGGNITIAGNDVLEGGEGTIGAVIIRGGIDYTNNPDVQNHVYINNLYVSGTTLGAMDETANLKLYSTFGMEFLTIGAGIRMEVGGASYGHGDDVVILAGQGGEPSLNGSSDGGDLILSAGHAGFNEVGNGLGGNVYISGGNAADSIGGDVFIKGGEGDNGTPGNVTISCGVETAWKFDHSGKLTLPIGGDIMNSDGQSVLGAGSGGGGGGGLTSRITANATTSSLANNATGNITISGAPSYMLMKVETSAAAWVRIYTSSTARTSDATRDILTDPAPGSGVLGEFITSANQTVVVTPAVLGFVDTSPVSSDIQIAVTNKSGSTAAITVTLTLLQLEA